MSRHHAIGPIPWMVCAAASAGVIGVFLFGLRGEPLDLGKYVGAPLQRASLQREELAEQPVTVSEGAGSMTVAAEPPAAELPAAVPAPVEEDQRPKDPQPVQAAASPAVLEPSPQPLLEPSPPS